MFKNELERLKMTDAPQNEKPPSPAADAPNVGLLPPTRLLLFILLGISLDWLFPVNFGTSWGGPGLLLVAGSLGVGAWAIMTFKNAGTNVPPNLPATVFVTDGPFQYTRNPMYLGMLASYIGVGMMADAPIMLPLAAGLWFMFDRQIIPAEENYLTAKFGSDYLDYKERVRRWV